MTGPWFDRAEAELYLDAVFTVAGNAALAFGYGPHRNSAGKYAHNRFREKFYALPEERESLLTDVATALALEPADVYINGLARTAPKRAKGNAAHTDLVWADADELGGLQRLGGLQPFVVASGSAGAAHVYQPLSENAPEPVREALARALAGRAVRADAKHADNDLLRLPGTVNCKPTCDGLAPARVRFIVPPSESVRLSLAEAQAALGVATGCDNCDGCDGSDGLPHSISGHAVPPAAEVSSWDGEVPEGVAPLLATGETGDRSAHFFHIVAEAIRAGLDDDAIKSVIEPWQQEHISRYNGRLAQQIAECRVKIEAEARQEDHEERQDDPDPGRPSQATQLYALALVRYDFGVSTDDEPYAVPRDGPRIARPLRGGTPPLRAELASVYPQEHDGRVPSAAALTDALMALEGRARQAEPVALALRVAEHEGGILLDLGGLDGRVVEITSEGWHVLDQAPVLFRRTSLTGALAMPRPAALGESLKDRLRPLRSRLNMSDEDWQLTLGWLVAALVPSIPRPVLALLGEQGTGKSTATRLLVEAIDPSPAPLRTGPRDVEQWAVQANASWVIGLDNLSGITPWLSDTLCRAVTGDGMVRRRLYTDSDPVVVRFQRPIVLNGIGLGDLRGDLADRLLPVELHRIGRRERRTAASGVLSEEERALVLGGLLDVTVDVLRLRPEITLDELPRMADFALVLAALDKAIGGNAVARYLGQADLLAEAVIDSDPLATALCAFARARPEGNWKGTAADLLAALTPPDPRPRTWPATAQGMGTALRRVAPALRQLGLTVERDRKGGSGARLWTVQAPRT